jgi:hypothetical protein
LGQTFGDLDQGHEAAEDGQRVVTLDQNLKLAQGSDSANLDSHLSQVGISELHR